MYNISATLVMILYTLIKLETSAVDNLNKNIDQRIGEEYDLLQHTESSTAKSNSNRNSNSIRARKKFEIIL